jgi:hypothetical protein
MGVCNLSVSSLKQSDSNTLTDHTKYVGKSASHEVSRWKFTRHSYLDSFTEKR